MYNSTNDTRSPHSVGTYYRRKYYIHILLYPLSLIPSEKALDLQMGNANCFKKFRNTLLKLYRPIPDIIHEIHHPQGLKLLTRLRLDSKKI